MRSRMLFPLLLMIAVPIWAQSEPDYQGGDTTASDSVMIAPPPVSGQAYPTEVGAETRNNYLDGGVTIGGGYMRNVYVGGTTGLTDETSFSIQPNISVDEVTPRQHLNLKYDPQFSFYEPTSSLNATNQLLDATYTLHVTPHVIISANNVFHKAAIFYGSPAFFEGVSASPPPAAAGAIPPLAHWTGNTAQGVVNWQYARAGMVGGSVTLATMRFADPSRVTGLFDSDSRGGSGFWARQISETQYLGAVYQYFDVLARPSSLSETQTHTFYAFYTQYLTDHLSLSVSAGPQHFRADEMEEQSFQAWTPALITSLGWQGSHTNLSISYDRTVTGGTGLVGAYHSYGTSASVRWQMTRSWTTSVLGSYASNKSVFPETPASSPFFNTNGHSISGGLTVDHWLTQHLGLEGEYDRIHQSYGAIKAIASAPNSDRVTVSLNWHFTRLLGR